MGKIETVVKIMEKVEKLDRKYYEFLSEDTYDEHLLPMYNAALDLALVALIGMTNKEIYLNYASPGGGDGTIPVAWEDDEFVPETLKDTFALTMPYGKKVKRVKSLIKKLKRIDKDFAKAQKKAHKKRKALQKMTSLGQEIEKDLVEK